MTYIQYEIMKNSRSVNLTSRIHFTIYTLYGFYINFTSKTII